MTTRDFCYWLRGYMELTETQYGENRLSEDGWKMVKEHLDKVFNRSIPDEDGFVKSLTKDDIAYLFS